MQKIKVFIVDDHALVRDGIVSMLSNSPEIQIIGDAASGNETINKIELDKPDIILMDIMMPDMSGIETGKLILKEHPEIKIIFLSMEVTEAFISDAVQSGASGYLLKDCRLNILIEAIKKVADGGKYFSQSVSELVFEKYFQNSFKGKKEPEKGVSKISKREEEVLKLIASGLSNKEIAEQLFLSVRTIDAHRNHIMQKLNLNSTAELVRYAIKNDMISL